MKLLLPRRWMLLLLMLTPVLVSISCITVLRDETPAIAQVPGDSSDGLTLQTEIEYGPGDFNLPDTKAGLLDLLSYNATLTMSFDGTHEESRQQWSKTYMMLVSKDPPARQLNVEKTGDISGPYPVLMAEAGGAAYERLGENACSANMIDPENSLAVAWEPAGFLTGVIGAEEAGSETINGTAANHYTFDERALGQSDVTQSKGEIWVASEGGYIVKYVLTTTGTSDYFGEGIEGTLTWDYEVTDVNQPVSIELPADCPAGMVNVPKLPDASNVVDEPGMLMYDTSSSLADAAAFYQEQLPDLGWELLGEPAITETIVLMDFIQGDQNLSVIISVSDTASRVQVLLDNSEE